MDISEIVTQDLFLKIYFAYVVMLDIRVQERNINVSSD